MGSSWADRAADRIDDVVRSIRAKLVADRHAIFVLVLVAVAGYGFDLFSLNVSIDEEVYATASAASIELIQQGRWGTYVLSWLVLPYTVVPFVPTALALAFHGAALLILLDAWGVTTASDRPWLAAAGLAFPGSAFLYTFMPIGFAVGWGFCCIAASVHLFARLRGAARLWGALPAAFAIAIYHGAIVALLVAFAVLVLSQQRRVDRTLASDLLVLAGLHVLALLVHLAVDTVAVALARLPGSSYVAAYFDLGLLWTAPGQMAASVGKTAFQVLAGDPGMYATWLWGLPALLVLAVAIVVWSTVSDRCLTLATRLFGVTVLLGVLVAPFLGGLAMRGFVSMRFLVFLPIAIVGIAALALSRSGRLLRMALLLCIAILTFQSVVSTNRLFAATHLALMQDRLLAVRLIERIDAARAERQVGVPRFIEVVGFPDRKPTVLVPRVDTFGASFFDWDFGNPARVGLFLESVGYPRLTMLPVDRRRSLIDAAEGMPSWPAPGSVTVLGDTAVIKFGPYSFAQRDLLCATAPAPVPSLCR